MASQSPLAAITTIIALIGVTPYIALQLQSITLSFQSFRNQIKGQWMARYYHIICRDRIGSLYRYVWHACNLNASERHEGVVTAIALEAVVKLIALVTVGISVCFWIIDDPALVSKDEVLSQLESNTIFFKPLGHAYLLICFCDF